jgi:two-component system response regulator GlrR
MPNSAASILLADDDESLRELLADLLASQGYRVVAVTNGREALEALGKERHQLLLTDLRMPGLGGEKLVEECLKRWPDLPIIVLTAYGTIEDALDLIRRGVYDYIAKPHKEKDLLLRIARALERERLTSEITRLQTIVDERLSAGRIIGEDPAVQEALTRSEAVAATDFPVVLLGESGTGKELFARFIHSKSPRRQGPFVPVNCGAVPRELFESELFGHARGAFTGAAADRRGLFEEAHGGTLFLDEIAEIPVDQQVKLLRVLQEGEVKRVGENAVRRVDVRVVSATNRDLTAAVREGRLREDLYYRISVMPIKLPPLRSRRGDLLPLAQHLLDRESAAMGKKVAGFTRAAAEKILAYPWPGNIRELENRIKQALVMAGGGLIDAGDLLLEEDALLEGGAPPARGGDAAGLGRAAGPHASGADAEEAPGPPAHTEFPTFNEARRKFEREYLVRILRRNRGNATAAAREAGKHRSEFYDLLKRHGLQPADFRAGAAVDLDVPGPPVPGGGEGAA